MKFTTRIRGRANAASAKVRWAPPSPDAPRRERLRRGRCRGGGLVDPGAWAFCYVVDGRTTAGIARIQQALDDIYGWRLSRVVGVAFECEAPNTDCDPAEGAKRGFELPLTKLFGAT